MEVKANLPRGLNTVRGLAKQDEILENCYYTENNGAPMIKSRPGYVALQESADDATAGSDIKHILVIKRFNGATYYILKVHNIVTTVYDLYLIRLNPSTPFYTVLNSGAAFSSGTGPLHHGDAIAEVGFTEMVILIPWLDEAWIVDTAEAITEITDVDFVSSVEAAFIAGRMVYCPEDGSPIFFSDVNAFSTIQAASFFDAEDVPDLNTGVIAIRDDLYVLGADTIRVFRAVGTGSSTFRVVKGAGSETGYIGGKIRSGESFMFVGRDREQGNGIFMMGQGSTQRISTQTIDAMIESMLPGTRIFAQRLLIDGDDLYIWSFQNMDGIANVDDVDNAGDIAVMFHRGNWSLLSASFGVGSAFNFRHATYDPQRGYFIVTRAPTPSEIISPNIGYLSANVGTDDQYAVGESLSSLSFNQKIVSYARSEDDRVFTVSKFRVSTTTRDRDANPSASEALGLRVSQHGEGGFGPKITRNITHEDQITWNPPGGLGKFNGYMKWELTFSGTVGLNIDNLVIDANG